MEALTLEDALAMLAEQRKENHRLKATLARLEERIGQLKGKLSVSKSLEAVGIYRS